MNQQAISTKSLVTTAMFTAIVAILSILELPSPTGVPFTLQTFAVALCGFVLGTKQGAFCIFLYVLLGAVGIPIYAGMTGGLSKLFGITGGFLFGFIPMAALCGLKKDSSYKTLTLLFALIGLILCHLLGALQFSLITTAQNSTDFHFFRAVLTVSLPYLPKDILSVAGAYLVSLTLKHRLKHTNLSLQ